MQILGISGSFRRESHNTQLLRAAAELLPPGAELRLFDGLADLPPYCEDADAHPAPAAVSYLREAIEGADALLIATPEYNASQIERLGISKTERPSYITGFNGSILGFSKLNDIKAIGLYAEIQEPQIPQYRSAKSIIHVLEKLTYHKIDGIDELDVMGEAIDKEMDRMKRQDTENC